MPVLCAFQQAHKLLLLLIPSLCVKPLSSMQMHQPAATAPRRLLSKLQSNRQARTCVISSQMPVCLIHEQGQRLIHDLRGTSHIHQQKPSANICSCSQLGGLVLGQADNIRKRTGHITGKMPASTGFHVCLQAQAPMFAWASQHIC